MLCLDFRLVRSVFSDWVATKPTYRACPSKGLCVLPGTGYYTRPPLVSYTLSEAWSGVNWADLIKIGLKGALGSHEIHPIHSAPSLGQNIDMRSSWALTGCLFPSEHTVLNTDKHARYNSYILFHPLAWPWQ